MSLAIAAVPTNSQDYGQYQDTLRRVLADDPVSLQVQSLPGRGNPASGNVIPSKALWMQYATCDNKDGWGGIATRDGRPVLTAHEAVSANRSTRYAQAVRRLSAEPSDRSFFHIRAATVGEVSLENAHPFRRGSWLMMHNGTIRGAKDADVVRDIQRTLGSGPTGKTDSERVFLSIIANIKKQTGSLNPKDVSTAEIERAIAGTVVDLVNRSPIQRVPVDNPQAGLSGEMTIGASGAIIFSDGDRVFVVNHGARLAYLPYRNPFAPVNSPPLGYFFSTEPQKLDGEAWFEVPEDHLLTFERDPQTGRTAGRVTPLTDHTDRRFSALP
jgi:predicted glutamine amidotransferase